jgi:cation transport ATPase
MQIGFIKNHKLGWAFMYNVIAIPLASLGIISPMIAAITMACSSLLVVGNSPRLKNIAEQIITWRKLYG